MRVGSRQSQKQHRGVASHGKCAFSTAAVLAKYIHVEYIQQQAAKILLRSVEDGASSHVKFISRAQIRSPRLRLGRRVTSLII